MSPARRLRFLRLLPVAALLVVIAVVLVLVLTSSSPSAGYDISFPQCGGSYPGSPVFGIVGVNGGLAHNANRCLADELRWALDAPGQKHPEQPPLSLYLVTGNPGADHITDWPKRGTTKLYGACNGLLTKSCSYLYGEQRSEYSYGLVAAIRPEVAKTADWWMDVETESSWAGTYDLNIAALQGYIAGLKAAGVTGAIGVYSTGVQWKELTGLTASTTPNTFKTHLLDWIAGTGDSLLDARATCRQGGFTGLAPRLAQYQLGSYDADLRCNRTS